jgi:hypothetical protein
MLVTFVPAGIAAGLVQWTIVRTRLPLSRVSAIPFALAFVVGQFPSYALYAEAAINGFGGLEGPPEWFVAVALALGGLLAGLTQFLGLPKTWRNFFVWVPASCAAWAMTAAGDLPIRGGLIFFALCSGLTTGLAMLALSPRQQPNAVNRRRKLP